MAVDMTPTTAFLSRLAPHQQRYLFPRESFSGSLDLPFSPGPSFALSFFSLFLPLLPRLPPRLPPPRAIASLFTSLRLFARPPFRFASMHMSQPGVKGLKFVLLINDIRSKVVPTMEPPISPPLLGEAEGIGRGKGFGIGPAMAKGWEMRVRASRARRDVEVGTEEDI